MYISYSKDGATTVFRLHGSYEALKYGSVLEGLADLTGGVVETLPLRYLT
jgi:hypothetical protein